MSETDYDFEYGPSVLAERAAWRALLAQNAHHLKRLAASGTACYSAGSSRSVPRGYVPPADLQPPAAATAPPWGWGAPAPAGARPATAAPDPAAPQGKADTAGRRRIEGRRRAQRLAADAPAMAQVREALAAGRATTAIAADLGVTDQTVRNWADRFGWPRGRRAGRLPAGGGA